MAWQRAERLEAVRRLLPPDAPQSQIAPEVAPRPIDPVFDKLGMSAWGPL
ncbi:MAG TPA: hypothetical protein VGV57_11690 [Thermoleophilaceae bacterium]|nr:hypothetical protein [Thermoleophilaceae bacterium]